MHAKVLWDSCLAFFEDSLTPQQFNSWIKPLSCEVQGNLITLIAPNSFILKLVQERFLPEIAKQAEQLFSIQPSFDLKIEKKPTDLLTIKNQNQNLDKFKPSIATFNNTNPLNASLSFNNFVTGKANQLAHAAALEVVAAPGTTYNPFFIYGGVGLGKTHLIQAIGNQYKKEYTGAKICYIHATNYISDVVKAFQTKKFNEL